MTTKKSIQSFLPAAPVPSPTLQANDILNSLPLGILVLDRDGIVVNSNKEAANLLGPAPQKLAGLELASLWPKTAADIASAMDGGRQAIGLVPPELDNCYIQVKPLPGGTGAAVTIFDQRLWQPYLQTSQPLDPLTPFYKDIFESSADGIAVVDVKGRLILVNEAAAKQIGLSRDEIQGRPVTFLTDNRLASDVISPDVLASGRPVTRMVQHLKTGRHVLLTGNPIFSPDGEVRLVVINKRDLTEHLELQTAIQKHKQAISHYKGQLADIQLSELAARDVVATSPAMELCMETASKIARYDPPQILITGERGTGKSLIAKYIHSKSRRSQEPLLQINCSAFTAQLLEAELFGYERGAFRGACPDGRAGLFEAAGRGTVFLDEISEMPSAVQTKLLTFLDTRSFRRVAGTRIVKSDCAIVAATSKDLRPLVDARHFKSELFIRLGVFSLAIPPLRERRKDIMELALQELARLNERYGVSKELGPEALDVLLTHEFPGNVRELLDSLHQAVLISNSAQIGTFLARILESSRKPPPSQDPDSGTPEANLAEKLHESERMSLLKAIATCRNTREMAQSLGISQAGVSRKLKKHGLPLPKNREVLLKSQQEEPTATDPDEDDVMVVDLFPSEQAPPSGGDGMDGASAGMFPGALEDAPPVLPEAAARNETSPSAAEDAHTAQPEAATLDEASPSAAEEALTTPSEAAAQDESSPSGAEDAITTPSEAAAQDESSPSAAAEAPPSPPEAATSDEASPPAAEYAPPAPPEAAAQDEA
ncbi:MAG: sigma 54-interacting transcriptional regulator [Deltaproteobacteria bacterium]|jgi:PAS domain S-box-containing protein|nr:sigma 54-interacting transcriptional regulator [Deltaproteobacteria bacterium]